jgi:hypothetical protein
MPADFLFPSVPGVSGVFTLSEDAVLQQAMLGGIVELNGHELTLATLPAHVFGVFYVVGPGTVAGGLTGELAEGESVSIAVHGELFTFNAQVAMRVGELADGATINWNLALTNQASVTLGGNRTLANPTNVLPGTYLLLVVQDGVGGRTLAFGDNYRFSSGLSPVLSTEPNAENLLTFVSFGGSKLYLVATPDFTALAP